MSSVSTGTFDESRRGIPMTGIDLYSLRYTWFSIDNKNEQALSNFRGDKPTHPIGCYPCHVYLIECHSNERIRVWLQESEAQVDKCSDYISKRYDYQRTQPCWVCKWLDWNEDWLINIEPTDDTPTIKPNFYRLIGDRFYLYGDGGESFLVYPV